MPIHSLRVVLILCAFVALGVGAAAQQVSRPLTYEGYSEAAYDGHSTHSAYIPVGDGVHIALDYFLPTGGPERESFPVILEYTPYQRSTANPETGDVDDMGDSGSGRFYLAHGYALAKADMRGTGASSGWIMDFMPELAADGNAIVEWIADQPWCDGNVGMKGASYLGWSQTATAMHQPEALKCIMPAVIPLEGYTGEIYPGGIYLQGFLKMWSEYMYYTQRSYFDPDQGLTPTKPAVDEDGDGDFHDEIPIDQNGNGTFLDDGEPAYRDEQNREDVFFEAIKEHQENLDYASWAGEVFYIDAKTPIGIQLDEISPNAHVPGIMDSGIPVYHVGGWFDGFARGSFELFSTMAPANPSRLIMFPGYHDVVGGPFYDYLGENAGEFRQGLRNEHLRFFDRYLKGIENGIESEPPIYIYVMNGEGWRAEQTWPLERQAPTEWFAAGGGQLQRHAPPEAGTDAYTADFTHNSSYGDNEGNRWLGIGGRHPSTLPTRTDKAGQCLTYTSAPLEADTEVTGHPLVHLWVSSSAGYGDFFVYLEDVSPEGEAVLVTEGQLRAGFAELHDNDTIIGEAAGIDVKPELPWHGYEEAHYNDKPFAGDTALELVIDFHPTSWVFRAGHRLRLSIACADHPTFRLHPKLSPKNDPAAETNTVPTVQIHRGDSQSTRLVLPVIPD